jgi:hypothetical protein
VSRAAAILALLLALAPELAHACAVCGAGLDDDQSRLAYIFTTISLSALPLAMFGSFFLYLRSKHRRQTTHGASGRGAPEPK